jgi:glucose-6-phosphate dehydrogenase assembly protein OpcA
MAGPLNGIDAAWQTTSPDSLDRDLMALWDRASASGPVSRAIMSNLIVVRSREANGPPLPVDDVLRRHPARAILIDYAPGRKGACSPESIQVNLLVFVNGADRYAVERIAVKTSCADASLPSLVRRLVQGDVPTSIWWASDAARWPVVLPLADEARQLVYDSADWSDVARGAASIAALTRRPVKVDLADVNWRRLAPLRQGIREAIALEHEGRFDEGFRVRVAHGPGQQAAAWLLAAWLRHADARGTSEIEPTDADVLISATIEGTGPGRPQMKAVWSSSEVRVESGTGRAPLILPAAPESPGAAVAAELDNLGRDNALRTVVSSLLRST